MKKITKSLFALAMGIGVTSLSTSAFAATAAPVSVQAQANANQLCPFAQGSFGSQSPAAYSGVYVYMPGQNGPISWADFEKMLNSNQFNFQNFQYPTQGMVPAKQPIPYQPTAPVKKPVNPPSTKPVNNGNQGQVTKPSNNQNQAQQNQTSASAYANQVLTLVNQERAKAGLKALTFDSKLSTVALDKAKDMANNHYFDHTSPTYGSPFDMMQQYGIQFSSAGENIAMGQTSPQEVMTQWMNSQGHRENILNATFTKIGIGYYNGYWVQEFIG
ncbi:UNVERIFIED_CONTAM: putative YkwD family protein [Brevibacillus sp. OAP136]